MLVKLDDDLMARYDQAAQLLKQPLAQVVERQLSRFADFPPTTRTIVLAGRDLEEIEKRLGRGQIQSPKQLVERVTDYAKITLGKIELELSASEKQELVYRAQKQGKPPEAIVQELVEQLKTDLFWQPTPVR